MANQRARTAFLSELSKHRSLYLIMLPGLLLFVAFNYLPMFGLALAFKSFRLDLGIFGSPWAKPLYRNFEFFFKGGYAWAVTRNTLLINLGFLVSGIVMEAGFALVLNEMRGRIVKRILQSLAFLPYFISWIVVGFFCYMMFNYNYGLVNRVLAAVGLTPVEWYSDSKYWPWILIAFNRWKWTGLGAIIYLAVLTGIDPSLYEVAEIDGATRFQKMRFISIPFMIPTVVLLSLLSVGRIMNADFGMFYAIVGQNPRLYPAADVIDTYVFRSLRNLGDFSMAAAVGFYQSVVSFILVLSSNALANRIVPNIGLFSFSRRVRE